tara:strand:+ start:86 stop:460 length:375 start_codon:yes stop_codon:yes gene_type:complete
MDFLELAERVETLESPDKDTPENLELRRVIHTACADYDCGDDELPDYLNSLDAAFELAGDGFGSLIAGSFPDGERGYVCRVAGCDAEAPTRAQAVTAAALRALAGKKMIRTTWEAYRKAKEPQQ